MTLRGLLRIALAAALIAVVFTSASTSARAQGEPRRAESMRTLHSFDSDADLQAYLARIAAVAANAAVRADSAGAAACGASFDEVRRSSMRADTEDASNSILVIRARVEATTGQPIERVNVTFELAGIQAFTDAAGQATLRIPAAAVSSSHAVSLSTVMIGFRHMSGNMTALPGDTVDVEFKMCPMALRLSQTVTTNGASVAIGDHMRLPSEDSVQIGNVAAVVGHFVVILREDRLFTIGLQDPETNRDTLRVAGMIDVVENGLESRNRRPRRLYTQGNRIVVFVEGPGYHDVELALFTVSNTGELTHDGTYQLRMTCDNTCDTRVIAGRLVIHGYFAVTLRPNEPYASLPAFRRWSASPLEDYRSLVTPREIFAYPSDSLVDRYVKIHALTVCDLLSHEMTCSAQAFVAPSASAFYLSPAAAYLWTTTSQFVREQTPGDLPTSVLTRFALDGTAPRAIRASGAPVGDESLRENDDGTLSAFVRGNLLQWWSSVRDKPDSSYSALVRVSLEKMGDGTNAISPHDYRTLPTAKGNSIESRFVGKWLTYGGGDTDIYMSESMFSSTFVAVPVRGGRALRLTLPHTMDRIGAIDGHVIVHGGNYHGTVVLTRVDLGERATVGSQHALPQSDVEYLEPLSSSEQHEGAEGDILGIAVRRHGHSPPGKWDPARYDGETTDVRFLRVAPGKIKELGALKPDVAGCAGPSGAECADSDDDRFEDARSLFSNGRVFALLDNELIEARVVGDHVRAIRKLTFAPKSSN